MIKIMVIGKYETDGQVGGYSIDGGHIHLFDIFSMNSAHETSLYSLYRVLSNLSQYEFYDKTLQISVQSKYIISAIQSGLNQKDISVWTSEKESRRYIPLIINLLRGLRDGNGLGSVNFDVFSVQDNTFKKLKGMINKRYDKITSEYVADVSASSVVTF